MVRGWKEVGGAVVIAVLIWILCAVLWPSSRTKLSAERQRATDAVSRMGSPGKFYTLHDTPNGPVNRLELAPVGAAVNDDNVKNLKGLTSVVGLDLSNSRITDAGLGVVAELVDLEYLQLAHTGITDEGLRAISTLANIEVIDLTGTRVTQAGAAHLENLASLKYVCAAGTSLVNVNGRIVDCDVKTESWIGIKHHEDWQERHWAIVSVKFHR